MFWQGKIWIFQVHSFFRNQELITQICDGWDGNDFEYSMETVDQINHKWFYFKDLFTKEIGVKLNPNFTNI